MLPSRSDVVLIGHRGACEAAPENTLAAFERAIADGADAVELDCRLTRDGAVVVLHDATLDRTTDGTGPVGEHTLAEVRALDAGGSERVPTLSEVLQLTAGRAGMLVELKSPAEDLALVRSLLGGLASAGGWDPTCVAGLRDGPHAALAHAVLEALPDDRDDIVVQSFQPLITALLCADGRRPVAQLASADADQPGHWEAYSAAAQLLPVAGVSVEHTALTADRLAGWRAAGRAVFTWTVNEPDDVRRALALGVDGVITDRPAAVRELIGC